MIETATLSTRQQYFILLFILASYLWLVSYTPNAVVQGESMYPTLYDQEKVYMEKQHPIERNQIVVAKNPEKSSYIVKRVIGIAGDEIAYRQGYLYLNGTYYTEPYVNEQEAKNQGLMYATADFTLADITGKQKIPKGYVFVMGDNRVASLDSREYGLLKEEAIQGVVTSYREGLWKKPIDKKDKEKIKTIY